MWVTELHRHLDVSIRTSTLYELAKRARLIEPELAYEAFAARILLTQPLESLEQVLATFSIFQKALASEDVLEQVAFEATEDCARDGIDHIEFRFSPAFVTEFHPSLSWQSVLRAFERGIGRAQAHYPAIRVGLIAIVSRDYGIEMAERTVDFVIAERTRFVGIDLAGNESLFPNSLFEAPFARAYQAGIPITVHAGESAGPESVWEALERLHAERIGHGVRSIEDPRLIDELRRRGTCLEVCPTSNVVTRAAPSFAEHPLPQLVRAGVSACINTDDPGVFGISLSEEVERCRSRLWLSDDEIRQCFRSAERAAFRSVAF